MGKNEQWQKEQKNIKEGPRKRWREKDEEVLVRVRKQNLSFLQNQEYEICEIRTQSSNNHKVNLERKPL